MKWLTRASFSERRFPGWRVWFTQILVSAFIAGFLSELLANRFLPKLFDIFAVFILQPLVLVLLFWLLALGCMRLWQVSFAAALGGLQVILPYVPLLPLVDYLLREFLNLTGRGFGNGWQALSALLTGGVLPLSLLPPALVLAWAACLLWIIRSWWLEGDHSKNKLIRALAPTYLGFPLLFLMPSFFGWLLMVGEVPIWSASPAIVARAFAIAQVDGYVWRNVYERFPFALGGEAVFSQAWLLAALAWLATVIILTMFLTRLWHWRTAEWLDLMGRNRLRRTSSLIVSGALLAAWLDTPLSWSASHLVAVFILAVSVMLCVLAQASRADLAHAARGALASERPLSTGAISLSTLTEWGSVWLVGGLLGLLLLGVPVLLAYAWAEVCGERLDRIKPGLGRYAVDSLPLAGYFLAGWMTMTARGSFGALAPALAGLVFCVALAWYGRQHWLDAVGKR